MNPPVEKSRPWRFLSLPHMLCIFAALIFFAAACACIAQGTGNGAKSPAKNMANASPVGQTAPAPVPEGSKGPGALIYYKQTAPLAPPPPVAVEQAASFPPDITRGDRSMMEVAITFDGGSGRAEEAAEILDALKERSIRATLFLTGGYIKDNPEAVRRMVTDGHEVGNHTLTHPHLTDYERNFTHGTLEGVDASVIRSELEGAAELFREVTGREMAPLWRAPYGEVNAEIRRWAWEAGYVHIGWTNDYENRESLDTLDWVHDISSRFYRTPGEIKDRVVNFGKGRGGVNGGIILMHLTTRRGPDRAALVLGGMLDGLTERGYRFVKVSTLIKDNAFLREARRKRGERVASVAGERFSPAHR